MIKKNMSVGEDVETRNLHTLRGGVPTGEAAFKNSLDSTLRKYTELLYGPTIILLGMYLREIKAYVHADACT